MTYIADLKQSVVREKAEMKRPFAANYEDQEEFDAALEYYNNHIVSLKIYPILPGNWIDGKEYQDSEIEIELKEEVATGGTGGKRTVYARLKQQPIETQEEMWREVLSHSWRDMSDFFERMAKSFSITRK